MTATLCGSCNERARCTHKNVKTRPANIPPAKKENIRTLGLDGRVWGGFIRNGFGSRKMSRNRKMGVGGGTALLASPRLWAHAGAPRAAHASWWTMRAVDVPHCGVAPLERQRPPVRDADDSHWMCF